MNTTDHLDGLQRWEQVASEAGADEVRSLPPVDEMGDKQHELLCKNYLMVCLIKNGVPVQEAINRAGREITESAAGKLLKRFEQHGIQGLVDQRFSNKSKKKTFTNDLKKRVLAWWFARPAAGPRAIWKELAKECKEREVKVPGYDTVKKYLKSLPEAYKLFRQGKIGIHEFERNLTPVVRFNLTKYSNQRWQIDNSRLDLWVRVRKDGQWVPAQAHLCACMCAHSRSIPGFLLSAKDPDAWTTALLLMTAIAPKSNPEWKNRGLPSVLQPDRGTTFLANAVASSLAYLKVVLDPDPPYYPNRKGKIERWFLTLDRGCLRILPGHMDAIGRTREAAEKHVHLLLTVPQLRKEIERWIVTDYHQQTHSETERKPSELWEETVRYRPPESEDALRLLLLKSDKERTVCNTGIEFKFGDADEENRALYWSPELTYYIGEKVRLRYNPEDRESILVYSSTTAEFICEAWIMGQKNSRYKIEDVKEARGEFRRGLQERLNDYVIEIERQDRKLAQEAEWDEAHLVANEEQKAAAEGDDTTNIKDIFLEAILDQFYRQDDSA